jgi:Uma2 family endonuclease
LEQEKMSAVLDRPKIETIPEVTTDPCQRVILSGISWETYERLLEDQAEKTSIRLTYDDGDLEIVVESYKHGNYSRFLEYVVIETADILEIDFVPAGSTTFREKNKRKGFEGDGSFYFKNAGIVRPKNEIDLSEDPAPELVLEIDITHDSLSKFPIFAGLGVEEVWRFDGEKVRFYRLENEDYREVRTSVCLPGVAGEIVTELLFAAQELKRSDWLKLVREKIGKND